MFTFSRWRANMILRNIPREEWPMLQLKCTAHEALKGQRQDWGKDRKWEGNYLAIVRHLYLFTLCQMAKLWTGTN